MDNPYNFRAFTPFQYELGNDGKHSHQQYLALPSSASLDLLSVAWQCSASSFCSISLQIFVPLCWTKKDVSVYGYVVLLPFLDCVNSIQACEHSKYEVMTEKREEPYYDKIKHGRMRAWVYFTRRGGQPSYEGECFRFGKPTERSK